MKSTGFLEIFRGNHRKNIPQEMKNGFSLRQQQLQVIIYALSFEFFISSLAADNTNAPQKNEQYFLSSLTP